VSDRIPDDPPPGVAAVDAPVTPEIGSLLRLAVAVVVIAALFVAQDVLIPITLAILLSFALSPVVTALGRAGLPRPASVFVTMALAFGALVLIGTLLAHQASTLAADAPRYAATIQQKLDRLELFAAGRLTSLTRIFEPREVETVPDAPAPAVTPSRLAARPDAAAGLTAAASAAQGRPVLVEVARTQTSPMTVARTLLEPIVGPLETTVIVLVIAIFILMEREDLRDRFIRLAGSNDLQRTTAAMDDAGQRLSRYFLSQLAVNGTFGLVIGIGLWVFQVPSPALWGVLAGLLRFVPYIGAILAAVAPIALAAATDPGWWRAIEVALLFMVVEPLTGYVVEPLLYGHSTGLAPISVIVAAVFWTWIWGPIGLILSTPLTLCLVVMGRHVKSLEFFDVLLGDRPALAPVENLYQRLLADNPDEVLEKAETLLEDKSLLAYYDEVMLPGLELAAQDDARGTLNHQRASHITRLLLQVVDDLADHEDPERRATDRSESKRPEGSTDDGARQRLPESGRRSRPVVACIAGRGPFDDVASAMLAQLLTRAGVPSRQIAHAQVSREHIGTLDLGGISVLALSYVDTAGCESHLRYLVRRLRQHSPGARVIVGLWPHEDGDDRARRQSIGADAYVESLREAMTAVAAALGRTDGKRTSPASVSSG
jgi:predicted PurR-regulated permease PerM